MIDIAVWLAAEAAQENCDGEWWDRIQEASDEIWRLRAELAALRPDADRYNWLTRNSGVGLIGRQQVVLYLPTDLILQPVEGLTAAIDQAMLAAKENTNATPL